MNLFYFYLESPAEHLHNPGQLGQPQNLDTILLVHFNNKDSVVPLQTVSIKLVNVATLNEFLLATCPLNWILKLRFKLIIEYPSSLLFSRLHSSKIIQLCVAIYVEQF
jgi:hypothetical protein